MKAILYPSENPVDVARKRKTPDYLKVLANNMRFGEEKAKISAEKWAKKQANAEFKGVLGEINRVPLPTRKQWLRKLVDTYMAKQQGVIPARNMPAEKNMIKVLISLISKDDPILAEKFGYLDQKKIRPAVEEAKKAAADAKAPMKSIKEQLLDDYLVRRVGKFLNNDTSRLSPRKIAQNFPKIKKVAFGLLKRFIKRH